MSGLGISTNVSSITAQTNMWRTSANMRKSISRLSSGLRVESAADDAAGMAVSENLKAQNRGFKQAMRNANEGVGILQVAESAYQKSSDILTRMRELAVQAASDGLSDTERGYLDTEFQDLLGELDRISDVTEYNGVKLMDGSAGTGGTLTFQVGTRNTTNDRITVTLADQDSTALAVNTEAVDSLATAQAAITAVDAAIGTLANDRASIGSSINSLTGAADHLSVTIENYSAANSGIRDVDVAAESASFAKSQVMQQAGVAMLVQANSQPMLALRLLNG
jgi:flagellin